MVNRLLKNPQAHFTNWDHFNIIDITLVRELAIILSSYSISQVASNSFLALEASLCSEMYIISTFIEEITINGVFFRPTIALRVGS